MIHRWVTVSVRPSRPSCKRLCLSLLWGLHMPARLVNEPRFSCTRALPERDFSNVETGTLLWLLHCGNMPSSKTSICKHPFKLAVSMVMTVAVFAVIVRSFAAVSKHFSCYFTQVILLRFIPFHSYVLFQLKGSTFTFCSNSSSLSYGGLGDEPHTGFTDPFSDTFRLWWQTALLATATPVIFANVLQIWLSWSIAKEQSSKVSCAAVDWKTVVFSGPKEV